MDFSLTNSLKTHITEHRAPSVIIEVYNAGHNIYSFGAFTKLFTTHYYRKTAIDYKVNKLCCTRFYSTTLSTFVEQLLTAQAVAVSELKADVAGPLGN
jgi:hypothetical protein